jgi:hypothetical protein
MDVQSQTKGCTRLLMSVIEIAVIDACLPPVRRNNAHKKKVNVPQGKSLDAVMFLLAGAKNYVEMVGMDGDRFKDELIKQMSSDVPGYFTNTIKGEQRRNFRFNYRWFQQNPAGGKFLTEEGEDEVS